MKEVIFYLPLFKKSRYTFIMLPAVIFLLAGHSKELLKGNDEFLPTVVVFGIFLLVFLLNLLRPIPLLKITDDAIYYSSKLRSDLYSGGLQNNLYPLFNPLTFKVRFEHIHSLSEETYLLTLTSNKYLKRHIKANKDNDIVYSKSAKQEEKPEIPLLLERLSKKDRQKLFSILKTKLS